MRLWTISTLQPQHGSPQKQDAELFLLILSTGNMDLLVEIEMIQVCIYQGNFGIQSRTLKANKNPTTENVRELPMPFVFLFSVIQE